MALGEACFHGFRKKIKENYFDLCYRRKVRNGAVTIREREI
jgi:hypothetical protein